MSASRDVVFFGTRDSSVLEKVRHQFIACSNMSYMLPCFGVDILSHRGFGGCWGSQYLWAEPLRNIKLPSRTNGWQLVLRFVENEGMHALRSDRAK